MGRCKETGKIHVTVDLKYYRPTEVVRTPLATQGMAMCGLASWEGILTADLKALHGVL